MRSITISRPINSARNTSAQYQAHLFADHKLGAIAVAQQLSALRFFFLHTLKRPWMVEGMVRPKDPIRLPEVLSREEVEQLIASNRLHRVWLLILYGTGIRREELVQPKVDDIDSGRMLIHIYWRLVQAETEDLPVPQRGSRTKRRQAHAGQKRFRRCTASGPTRWH